MYRTLSAEKIVKTAGGLAKRIEARFPDSNLWNVSGELLEVAQEAQDRCREIAKPNKFLRVVVGLLLLLGITMVGVVVLNVRITEDFWDLANFVGVAEALVADLVFVGIGVAFLVTLETRLKRARALDAINELRAIAHIIDMHQLTKDPEMILRHHAPTDVSPSRTLSAFELNRYLDYCSEMLALVAKIGALYVQSFPDSEALKAVDEIESLASGLSRKIWQKIMILDRYVPGKRTETAASFPSRSDS